ncbi:MAG: DUF1295 domain-containing protein [Bacteriovoracaceae bacterium]
MNNITLNLIISLPALMLVFTGAWYYCFKTKIFAWLDFVWCQSFIIVILIKYLIELANTGTISFQMMDLLYLVWATRLGTHLFLRISKHGEDKRYVLLKNKWKVWYGMKFFLLFQLEAFVTIILSIPLLLTYQGSVGPIQYVSIVIFFLAILGEFISDKQLREFIQKNNDRSKVCDVGFWKYSRHPNYFFEWMVWISFAVYALSSIEKWPGILPPIVMYIFLTKITGIPPAEESSLLSKRENYMIYQKTTNAFFPWFPKKLLFIALTLLSFSITKHTFASGEVMNQQEKMKKVFNELRADNIQILDNFYAQDTVFIDPLGKHNGILSVKAYYQNLYKNVKSIHFKFNDIVSSGNTHALVWTMTLEADGLNGGKPITLEGNSHIKFNDANLVVYHRDYFDMGEFIYEHVPVLGWTIKKVKEKLKN